jgi:hypothetical protein
MNELTREGILGFVFTIGIFAVAWLLIVART